MKPVFYLAKLEKGLPNLMILKNENANVFFTRKGCFGKIKIF